MLFFTKNYFCENISVNEMEQLSNVKIHIESGGKSASQNDLL